MFSRDVNVETCRTAIGCRRGAKELRFIGATLTRPHAVDKITSETPALEEIPKKGPGPT